MRLGKVTGEVEKRRPRGQLNVTREDKIRRGISLSATCTPVRVHTHTHTVAQVQATAWKEDLLQLTTQSSFQYAFLNTGLQPWEGMLGGTGDSWNARPWLLWVKPPTCGFWKGWCAGWDLDLDLSQLALAVPTRVHLPGYLASSSWES